MGVTPVLDAPAPPYPVPFDEQVGPAIAATVKLILDSDIRAEEAGLPSIPPAEVIAQPNPKGYLVPTHLHKTAPDLVEELEWLLAELRELNAEYVGRNTNEVQSYLSLTGEHEALEEHFYSWCKSYFSRRGSLDRLQPRVKNDPFELYRQCVKEFKEFPGWLHVLEGTANMAVLGLSDGYIASEFADQVLCADVSCYQHAKPHRFASLGNAQAAENLVVRCAHGRQNFAAFLREVGRHLPPAFVPDGSPDWEPTIRKRVELRAEELGLLRFALCHIDADLSTPRQLAPAIWSRCGWDVYHGRSVLLLLTGADPTKLDHDRTTHGVAIRRDGWLCCRAFPWLWLNPDAIPEGLDVDRGRLLGTNLFVLESLTQPLYQKWDELDVELVVRRGTAADAPEDERMAALAVVMATAAERDPDDPGLEVVASFDLSTAATEETAGEAKGKKVGVFRLRKFVRILRNHFDCDWSQGKGSEIKVIRQGSHYYRFANHGHGEVLGPHRLRDCLERLHIPLADFLAVCR